VRVGITLALALAVALVAAVPASAQDRDCSDFDNQADAQQFFENSGPGDPHGLDGDGDGIACQTLPCPCSGDSDGDGTEDESEGTPRRNFQTIRAQVIRVIDGDTIVVRPLERTKRPRYRVRLIGIDSPEFRPKECGSGLAAENARRLASARPAGAA
jgi:endonuclease YncB( thermonuclease family)